MLCIILNMIVNIRIFKECVQDILSYMFTMRLEIMNRLSQSLKETLILYDKILFMINFYNYQVFFQIDIHVTKLAYLERAGDPM